MRLILETWRYLKFNSNVPGANDNLFHVSIWGLPADIEAKDLQRELQSMGTGDVAVQREGTCEGYVWIVEWTESGGNKELLQVTVTTMNGLVVDVTTSKWRHSERDGVSNHQPDDCLLNCSFKQIKENIKAPRYWPLWGESISDRWILLTKGQ